MLLEGATLPQNLAMPFTLEIDPVPEDIREWSRAWRASAASRRALLAGCRRSATGGESRVHLARAVALEPELLLLEHPTAPSSARRRRALAADVVRVCAGGRCRRSR